MTLEVSLEGMVVPVEIGAVVDRLIHWSGVGGDKRQKRRWEAETGKGGTEGEGSRIVAPMSQIDWQDGG